MRQTLIYFEKNKEQKEAKTRPAARVREKAEQVF